ncbi:MAG: DNA repair protein RadA/Sms [Candidatus Tokpelaia sp. JSC085]|nr:MAG: DNA repair protein RadA/Sms [Candidatus Tokpelaia sp. JSC085]
MARAKIQYICQNCGIIHTKWIGKCDSCGKWNTLVQESSSGIGGGPNDRGVSFQGQPATLTNLSGKIDESPRIISGMTELDRVTGGGFVRGSALLVGGDPGIGKSTLLMQTAAALARKGYYVIYVSGEEAVAQIRLRAQRLGAADTSIQLAIETNVENVLATLARVQHCDLVIIDSIQTLWSVMADSSPGTVTQVRLGAQVMVRFAKQTGSTMILVGHVTKDGQIAGPRVVEHMVDGVFSFESGGGHHYRILRATKNRFGATDEIGVFEMSDCGLREVSNPSRLFLGERHQTTPGASVFAGIEGTRPVLVEIQALVATTSLGSHRRAVVGWDSNRLAMIIAILEARCNILFSQHDVYLNVVGGYRITEPAADLAVAAALISSFSSLALPLNCVYFGEVSLSGGLRPVSYTCQRLKEAEKLGFRQAVLPRSGLDKINLPLELNKMDELPDVVAQIAVSASQRQKKEDTRIG